MKKGDFFVRKLIPVFVCAAVAIVLAASRMDASGANADAGKANYQRFCAGCHGINGKGDGPSSQMLNPKPRDHTNAKYMKNLSDEHIFKAIKMGGAGVGKSFSMPSWGGQLSDKDIENIVAFIRTLSK
ncbi:MAG: cytochrome c [Nitrospinaceae bacterium]|nr:cytochrome c [Nitrospinaceae bacterium]MBT3434971.1 cytochrome c [Nitrospinaceae bacterium]MBT3819883.1 cytochrome c [Nitrospinaceae bacterium]MBT4094936.1 cytochrome c [Nitrospinaceae bacterium]MBT4430004.1 cytochrome c [Nitrospinaceae bacterium]